jgi:hypothetical protein
MGSYWHTTRAARCSSTHATQNAKRREISSRGLTRCAPFSTAPRGAPVARVLPASCSFLRRALDTAAAYGSELIQDNSGNTKPTAFHFTAGQQQFMKAVSELQLGVVDADLREALVGPWLRESTLPNMSWDSTNARFYALRATNPSGDKKTTVAGADWLAFMGLGLLPSFPRGGRLMTTCIKGGWKDSQFTWPVWEGPSTRRVASSIIRAAGLKELSPGERRARCIPAVFTSSISRSEQGGYGSFSPAEVA